MESENTMTSFISVTVIACNTCVFECFSVNWENNVMAHNGDVVVDTLTLFREENASPKTYSWFKSQAFVLSEPQGTLATWAIAKAITVYTVPVKME